MVAVLPATFHSLLIGVAVVSNEVLNEMLWNAENQGATLPLDRGKTITQNKKTSKTIKSTVRQLPHLSHLQFLPSSDSFSSSLV